jgi:hypothetical protein
MKKGPQRSQHPQDVSKGERTVTSTLSKADQEWREEKDNRGWGEYLQP